MNFELEELVEFRENNFSHNSAEEFLRMKRDFHQYEPIHLSIAYVDAKTDDKKIYNTEIELARRAIESECTYVTNIDYCGPCIAATGLRRSRN